MPAFNRDDVIAETLDSLLAQTEPNWEAVIVDDGSTDTTRDVIGMYASRDARFRLLTRPREPKGACTCRNIAVGAARGRYVLFLDTDDLLAPHCLAQRVAAMDDRPELDFAIFPMLVFSGRPAAADRLWNVETPDDDLERLLRFDPICQGTGTLWRRQSFIDLGLWDERLAIWQDIELHLRAFIRAAEGTLRYERRFDLPPDVLIRESAGSLSRGEYHSRPKLESRVQVVRDAVRLLRAAGRPDLVPMVRYLCAGVVVGAATTGNLDLARTLREWGRREGVLTPGEAWRLGAAELFRRTRLDRLAPIRGLRARLTRSFDTPNTIGVARWKAQSGSSRRPHAGAN
jgi:glycosyltransferase involved in cell wall biosynthesis